jgi:tetratricopeptide (TPR) repeat protein
MMQGIRIIAVLLAAASFAGAQRSARDNGIAAFDQGRYSAALRDLQTAVSQDPHDNAARTFLALAQAASGNCKIALPQLAQPSSDPKLDKLAGIAAAKCYSAAGDQAHTFARLQELETRFPNDADVLYLDAKLHMKAFNDATFAMFQRTPASYRVHELSAEVFEVQNRYADAIAEFRRAIELAPDAPDLHYRLGRAILLASHTPQSLEQAAAEFRSELRVNPEDAASEYQLGEIAQAQTDSAAARACFERAVALSPDFVQALIALGKIESHQKHYTHAIELLNRAARLQPDNEAAHYALMTAYRDSGQPDKAQSEKDALDRLKKPPEGEFSEFLRKLGDQPPKQ